MLFSFFTRLTFVLWVQKEWRGGRGRDETAGNLNQIKAVPSNIQLLRVLEFKKPVSLKNTLNWVLKQFY